MSEHLIRFRGGWLSVDPESPADRPIMSSALIVTLPITWPDQAGSGRRVRLVRSFAAPPLDPDHDRLALRLTDVEGLASASLNGKEIARPARGTSAVEIVLPEALPPRNFLVLDVELAPAGTGAGLLGRPWGAIALVITSGEPSHPSDELLGGTGSRP